MCSELYPNLYRDETALRLINQIDYDFSLLSKKSKSLMQQFGFLEAAMRQNDLAWEVRDYLRRHPNAAVVNLGCGLDDTGRSCDNGTCKIYNLGQHRTIRQADSARDFSSSQDLKSAGILYVFQAFQTAGLAEKIRRSAPTQLCGVALDLFCKFEPAKQGGCHLVAVIDADICDDILRLVLQPLRAGEWDLVCAHCPGTDFVGRVVGAKNPQCYPLMCLT